MKKYMFLVIFILSTLLILLIPKDIITKNYEIEYEIINPKEKIYVYYIKEGKLIGVPIEEDGDKFQKIDMVFKYLTEKSNFVSTIYNTNLNLSSRLLSYEIRNNDIYLEVNDHFLNIKQANTLLALSQVLYSYKDLGYDEVYILHKGEIIKEIYSVVLDGGLKELPVNLMSNTTSYNSKTIKITYYYKNGTKSFLNYIVNSNVNDLEFKVEKLIDFYNLEYDCDIKLLYITKDIKAIYLVLNGSDHDLAILKSLIGKNIDEKNIHISVE